MPPSELPDKLWPFTVRVKRDGDEEPQLWLEDVDVAEIVLDRIRTEEGIHDFEGMLTKEVASLSRDLRPSSPLHRRFARRIVREVCRAYPSCSAVAFGEWKEAISALLPFETKAALAYGWIPYLSQEKRKAEAERVAANLMNEGPQSVAEAILMIEAFGDDRVRQTLEAALPSAKRWHTEAWASFVEYLRPLDDESQSAILELAVPLLKDAPVDFNRLLDTRNVALDLMTTVEKFGRAEHREWLLTIVNAALPFPPTSVSLRRSHLIAKHFPLVERCIFQGRNRIVLIITPKLLTMLSENAAIEDLHGNTYDLYRAAYDEEQLKSHHTNALNRSLAYAAEESAPTKAFDIWTSLFGFASKWAGSQWFSRIEAKAYEFLGTMLDRPLPPKLFQELFLSCARELVSRHNCSQQKLRILLRFFEDPPATHAPEQLLILLAGAVVKQEASAEEMIATRARTVLKTFALKRHSEAITCANNFLRAVMEHSGMNYSDRSALMDSGELERPVVFDLLYCLGNCPWNSGEQLELADGINGRWPDVPRWNLTATLLNLQAANQSKSVIDALLSLKADDPDALLLAASWEARFGSLEVSEQRVLDSLRVYLTKNQGAHPPQIRRAYLDLAKCSSGAKREVLELCAALQAEGPLRPLFTFVQS
jgi:hypothetical protein